MATNRDIMLSAKPGDTFVVLGFGVTGKALAEFLSARGFRFLIADDACQVQCTLPGFIGQVSDKELVTSHQKFSLKAVLPSPGVGLTHPLVQRATETGIPVIGDLELASFYLTGEFIAVTGTNGKSTTVKLISALLEAAGVANLLKGNIGSALITALSQPPQSYYVLEESSYQLELVGALRHRVAVCLNVTDDHLDRYPSLKEYAAAKAQILKNSSADDWFIYNSDDAWCVRMAAATKAKKLPYSLVNHFERGVFVDGKKMVICLEAGRFEFDLEVCSLKGLHNIENMLAALASVLVLKNDAASVAAYKKVLTQFEGLPHRLQKVGSFGGVTYYDDSKATNVGAVVMALASFDGNVILIAGGRDKLGDYSPLKGLVKGKVKELILLGEAKTVMANALNGTTKISLVSDMKDAVSTAKKIAAPGDTVLLSPACSSFDQYKNYAERGADFCKWVEFYAKGAA